MKRASHIGCCVLNQEVCPFVGSPPLPPCPLLGLQTLTVGSPRSECPLATPLESPDASPLSALPCFSPSSTEYRNYKEHHIPSLCKLPLLVPLLVPHLLLSEGKALEISKDKELGHCHPCHLGPLTQL